MARIDKRRAGARTNARPVTQTSRSTSSMGGAIEDTMFFPRLRRHTKWMFVLLAVVFGLGFVFFGIGAGGTGLGDLFKDHQNGGGGPNVKKALEATQAQPRNAQAWATLANAYRTNGDTEGAAKAQVHFTQLRPKNADGFRTLASDYFAVATARATEAQDAQITDAYSGKTSPVTIPSLNGKPIFDSPLASLSQSTASSAYTTALTAYQSALSNAITAYKRVAALSPNDPNVQRELASNALQAGDSTTAIQAFRRYLKLAPDSSDAPLVRSQLKQLIQQTSGSTGTTASP